MEQLLADSSRDLRPISPALHVLMRHNHPARLPHGGSDRLPVIRRQRLRRSINSTDPPQSPDRSFTAACSARGTTAPYVTTVRSLPCLEQSSPSQMESHTPAPDTQPAQSVSRYSRLCSRNKTGSSHRIAVRSSPIASSALEGITIRTPGVCVKIDSRRLCEW